MDSWSCCYRCMHEIEHEGAYFNAELNRWCHEVCPNIRQFVVYIPPKLVNMELMRESYDVL